VVRVVEEAEALKAEPEEVQDGDHQPEAVAEEEMEY
jgi:hypothetical protein